MNSKVFDIIEKEQKRQDINIELIASENFPSENVKKAAGSCFVAKYAEGYPPIRDMGNKGRYYGGCENCDELENYCIEKWKEVFNTDYHVNVQPHSGSQANEAAYMAVLKPGDTILSLNLNTGGHLSHGSPVNFSGKLYRSIFYDMDENGYIDYNNIKSKIYEYHPDLILAGASAYPRIIDFEKIKEIIDEYKSYQYSFFNIHRERPYFMVDMAHIAGLIAAGDHPSPFGLADIITTTTHKTLRGTRGGLIFCRPELAKKVDSAVFPGTQGGPLMHIIAAKAVTAEEACTQEYKDYIHQVVKNTKAMANKFKELGYSLVTDGTDNHLFLLDFSKTHPTLTGAMVQDELDKYDVTVNKNCVPNEKRSPKETSGIRIGLAAMTTKGWTEKDCENCAVAIDKILNNLIDSQNDGK